jgi:hypothetical protein
MLFRRTSLRAASTVVLLATGSARAHNGEFLLAKATPLEKGRLALEITADYGNNPLIPTEAAAAEALRGALQLEFNGASHPLEAFGPIRFEKRSDPVPDSPLPTDPAEGSETHWLLTALWEGCPGGNQARLLVSPNSPHSVVVWTAVAPGKPPRWALLLGGEYSPIIPLSAPQPLRPLLYACAGVASGTALLGLRRISKKTTPSPANPAIAIR